VFIETAKRIELTYFGTEAILGLPYNVLEENSDISKNKGTYLWNFFPNSERIKFRNRTSIDSDVVNVGRRSV